jgi:hypothetical protein
MTQSPCRHLHPGWSAVLLLVALTTACDRSDTAPRGPGDAQITDTSVVTDGDTLTPPLPQDCPPNRPPQTEKELQACVGKLKFDTLPEAGDQQRLLVVDQGGSPCPGNSKRMCRHGPLARIEPLQTAHNLTLAQLREGRIIARLSIANGQEGYPKLNLAPGHKTYWWVQRDPSGSGGKSVYVSDSLAAGTLWISKPRELEARNVPVGTFKQALARWLWSEDDETAKGTCGSASCK